MRSCTHDMGVLQDMTGVIGGHEWPGLYPFCFFLWSTMDCIDRAEPAPPDLWLIAMSVDYDCHDTILLSNAFAQYFSS